jgi:hypoxanthine phosphoribosyltransferase
VLIGVLRGAVVFVADLIRALQVSVTVDFVGLSSYGARAESSGTVAITTPLQVPIEGRDVLVVEDILDTGRSMSALLGYLRARSPRSIRLCALLDKQARRVETIAADYVGFVIPDGFVVGYGIDYADRYRQLPAIYRVETDGGPLTAGTPTADGPMGLGGLS